MQPAAASLLLQVVKVCRVKRPLADQLLAGAPPHFHDTVYGIPLLVPLIVPAEPNLGVAVAPPSWNSL
jgi:hypothetical protein